MSQNAYVLWGNQDDPVLVNLLEKTVAETKCRQDNKHPPGDSLGIWEKDEAHLGERRPFLNNAATALRRQLSETILDDFEQKLNIYLFEDLAPDEDAYNNQDFADEVGIYQDIYDELSSATLPGPTKGRGVPYDILEFVPTYRTGTFQTRPEHMRYALVSKLNRYLILAPRGDARLLAGRDDQEYQRNEHFVDRTLGLIFELLALDPGLTSARMADIAQLFHSMILEPWFREFGNERRLPGNDPPQGHEAHNLELRDAIIALDNAAAEVFRHDNEPDFIDQWWPKACYSAVVNDPSINGALTVAHVQHSVKGRWRRFYSNWLQILANVEMSHTKLSQEQLNNESLKSCPVCADDYDVESPYNCPVLIGCPNQHTLCKKCYSTLSLTPTRPFNSLMTDKHCPQCRSVLTYVEWQRDLTEDLNLMPRLYTDVTTSYEILG